MKCHEALGCRPSAHGISSHCESPGAYCWLPGDDSLSVTGALAAFSLDDFYAEAKVQDEILTIFGKNPGLTHVVVVVRDGTKTFEVQVLAAPPSYPPGFVQPLSASAASENSSYESRYTSGPSQSENTVDFMRREGDQSMRFHLSGTFLSTPVAGQSAFSISSVFYQILTPHRDITFLDQLMTNSPLTVDGSIVRGFHFRQGGFVFHVGYTSLTTFENFILPSLKEGVIGVGYRFSLGAHASLTPNFYFFPGRPASENIGQRGTVASLVYDYEPRKTFGLLAEAGFSHGVGAAARFHFDDAHDQLSANRGTSLYNLPPSASTAFTDFILMWTGLVISRPVSLQL